MKFNIFFFLSVIFLFITLNTGCGQRGPLKLPEPISLNKEISS